MILAASLWPGAAHAATIAGGTIDPVDQAGGPDIVGAGVSYDSDSGSVSVTLAFATPIPVASGDGFQFGLARRADGSCSNDSDQIVLQLPRMSDAVGAITRAHWLGRDPLAVTWNGTRTAVRLETTNLQFAGGSYDCARGNVLTPRGGTDEVRSFWLLAPGNTPPTALAPVKPRLAVTAIAFPCRALLEIFGSSVNTRAPGRIRYVLRGPELGRTISVATFYGQDPHAHADAPRTFRHLRRGHYVLTVRYLGGLDVTQDPPQPFTASDTVTKRFSIRSC